MAESRGQLSTPDGKVFFDALRGLHTTPHIASNAVTTVDVLKQIISETEARSAVAAGLPAPAKLLVESALKGVKHSFVEDLRPADAVSVISKADIGITWAQYAAAKNGALVEVVYDDAVKLASSLPKVHIAMLSSTTLLPDLDAAMGKVSEILRSSDRRPTISLISGPSKTADIELMLIYGVHGPHALHVLMLDWL